MSLLPSQFQPMRLAVPREPFDNPEWLYELKLDGFRALAIIERGQCRLVSRNGNVFASFGRLAELLPKELRSREAVLDGEIVCMDRRGRPQFNHLLFRRGIPRFAAFDLLWCDGEDTRYLPLTDRKQRVRQIIRGEATMAMYVHHIDGDGVNLFQEVCRRN